MLKLNKLFYYTQQAMMAFSDCIEPSQTQKDYLVSCKNDIREYLRETIKQATVTVLGMPRAITPRFRTQGSWSYRTCIQPAFPSIQEMDWDFGVYLPVTVWEENGPPKEMAQAYFALVERLLLRLCQNKNWKLVEGKDTCIRIQVASWAHIDVPLYAAPEAEFEKIYEKVVLAKSIALDSARLAESAEFSEVFEAAQEWADLDQIVMATRSGEWKASDPEAVTRWFRDRLLESGDQLRRVCRYLKAWRDQNWQEGGPTSVSIMIAISSEFEPQNGRDDLALEMAATRLANALANDLYEPAIDGGSEDFNRLKPEQRQYAAAKAQALASAVRQARMKHGHQKDQALREIRTHLGDRIPSDLALIDVDGGEDAVRTTPAIVVVPPVVPATKAG